MVDAGEVSRLVFCLSTLAVLPVLLLLVRLFAGGIDDAGNPLLYCNFPLVPCCGPIEI